MNFLIQRIRHYLHVYAGFISTSFSDAMNFRLHFCLLIVVDFVFYTITLASVHILYDHINQIGAWNREQFTFFVCIMLAINQLHMSFVSKNFWQFSVDLRMGMLDFYLLKPINSLFLVFLKQMNVGSFCNVILTWGALVYFGLQVDLSWYSWIFLPFLVFLGFILGASIEMILGCGMFWMLEGTGINFLRMEMQQLARWPDFIYGDFIRRIMTFIIPVLLIGSPSARFLFNYGDWWPLLGMGVALILSWAVLAVAWQAGLKTYESASS